MKRKIYSQFKQQKKFSERTNNETDLTSLLDQECTEEVITQDNKSYLWQNCTQYTTQWWNTESLLTKIWNKTRMPILTISIQHSIGILSHSNHTWKKKKVFKWRGRFNIVIIYRYDTVQRKPYGLYTETTGTDTQIKLAGYKISIQKKVAFLYSNNEISERECKLYL